MTPDKPGRSLEMLDGRLILSGVQLRLAKLVLRLGMVGMGRNDRLQQLDCVVLLRSLQHRKGQVILHVGVVGSELQFFLEFGNRVIGAIQKNKGLSRVVMRSRGRCVLLNYLAEDFQRIFVIASLVVQVSDTNGHFSRKRLGIEAIEYFHGFCQVADSDQRECPGACHSRVAIDPLSGIVKSRGGGVEVLV